MFKKTAQMGHPWYSTAVWTYRTIVGLDFLLAGLFFTDNIEPDRIRGWLIISSIAILFSTAFFAIRMIKDRTARNDFMLGLFWLILVACAVFEFREQMREFESHGYRLMRQR
jgi:hypothetical protein